MQEGVHMGFFSPTVICNVCNEKAGLNRFQLKNKEWVCAKCFKEAGFTMQTPIRTMSADDVKRVIAKRKEDANTLRTFKATKTVGGWLQVDENQKKWFIPDGFAGSVKNPRIHDFSEITGYELLEDGNTVTKGGLGRAVVGGALFGVGGAIVGGVTGGKKSKSTCTSMKIKITLNSLSNPTEYINLIAAETKKTSMIYTTCASQAQEILSILQIIVETNEGNSQVVSGHADNNISGADEIMKYKQLLDNGIISQEEFDAKKKQILGL